MVESATIQTKHIEITPGQTKSFYKHQRTEIQTKPNGRDFRNTKSHRVSKYHMKINDFGAKGIPKSTKMVPRRAPKSTLEAHWFQELQEVPTPGAQHTPFGTIRDILASILGSAGRQGGPKIKRFGPMLRQKLKK